MKSSIDINCDLGEGVDDEHLIMPYISSCNIACGGHYGDSKSMDKTIQLAIEHQVNLGAHPSFPDKSNFGRKPMLIKEEYLRASLQNQMDLFVERLSFFNQKLHHIKPHGALYNGIVVDKNLANIFVESVKKYLKGVFLYVPCGSMIEKVAVENNLPVRYEAFADRMYHDDLTLVARNHQQALLTNKTQVLKHVLNMARKGKVKTISASEKDIKVDTFCIHGDTENALEIARHIFKNLKQEGFKIGY